ncbi:MAG: AIM24 family protein [Lachnospiraceae bacterium]|nr:AIM24 family protein [Lachnospiraceae bacterium]
MKIVNFQNDKRKITAMVGNLSVLEYLSDASVSPANAEREYFMSRMGLRKRQVICKLDGKNSIITQAGAMQWTGGNVQATSGIKGVGDLFGKMVKGAVTKESAVKPEYVGQGILVLEPTYKYIILEDISRWPSGMTIEDGMFLACEGTVKNKVVARRTLSSAALGNEGLFNLSLYGTGAVALESNVPAEELIEIELDNDELKIDGDMAVCWSTNLDFTVERSSKTLLGSAINGEGLVNVYRGTGRVLMSPVAVTHSLAAAAAPTPLKGR